MSYGKYEHDFGISSKNIAVSTYDIFPLSYLAPGMRCSKKFLMFVINLGEHLAI
jgi:hypothetical protein